MLGSSGRGTNLEMALLEQHELSGTAQKASKILCGELHSRALLHLLVDAEDSDDSLAHNGKRSLVQYIKCLRLICLPLAKPVPLLE